MGTGQHISRNKPNQINNERKAYKLLLRTAFFQRLETGTEEKTGSGGHGDKNPKGFILG